MHTRLCRLILLFAVFTLPSESVLAAVTCIMNSATGKYEAARASSPSGPSTSSDCAMQSVTELHKALNSSMGEYASTRIFDGIVVTNAATLPEPVKRPPVLTARASTPPNTRVAPATAITASDTSPALPLATPSATPKPATWEVLATDIRLATTFERWAKAAGFKVQWDASKHVLISATPTFTGDFENAVSQALSTPAILYSAYPLEACRYEQTPPLIRITRQGEQAKDCPEPF